MITSKNSDVWCNWFFVDCLVGGKKWIVYRDCGGGNKMVLTRGDSRNWKAYRRSLEPYSQGQKPRGICPNCGRYINGLSPYDDGETWEL
jgi:hypothetical protein